MLIINKKQFGISLFMIVVFIVVLTVMFTPVFHGKNAFQASDGLFNSISKASTNHIADLHAVLDKLEHKNADQTLVIPQSAGDNLAKMLTDAGAQANYTDNQLQVSGDLKVIFKRILADSEAMFNNNGDTLKEAYGIDPKVAMYDWWVYTNASSKAFLEQKRFPSAKVLEEVKTKGIEVGYNYFGVEPTPVTERIGITTFALVFYVVYTLWWGYAIFFLCEGLGLMMVKSSKKEA